MRPYSWADNVIVLESQFHAMSLDAIVPWRAQATFEATLPALLSTGPTSLSQPPN
ncbi:hypothetical protein V8E36_001666 [Tilletia maclaganii]